jgi:hypothetical protein
MLTVCCFVHLCLSNLDLYIVPLPHRFTLTGPSLTPHSQRGPKGRCRSYSRVQSPRCFEGTRRYGSDQSALFTEGTQAVTGCSGTTITPTCLANLYSFTSAPATLTKGLMGIAGFLEQWPSKSDLTTFMNNYAYFANKAYSYTCTLINGGTCPSSGSGYPGIEANLDVQYARAITSEIPNV